MSKRDWVELGNMKKKKQLRFERCGVTKEREKIDGSQKLWMGLWVWEYLRVERVFQYSASNACKNWTISKVCFNSIIYIV
jgi:hypothetical protein